MLVRCSLNTFYYIVSCQQLNHAKCERKIVFKLQSVFITTKMQLFQTTICFCDYDNTTIRVFENAVKSKRIYNKNKYFHF